MKNLVSKNLSIEERALWNRVNQLWECSVDQDIQTINKAIHPKYIGWDNNSLLPHDRDYVLQSVTDNASRLLKYNLHPLGVSVYEHQVGIANYRYRANISDLQKTVRVIKGRWTEIYLKKNQNWTLIGVHGGPEPLKVVSTGSTY